MRALQRKFEPFLSSGKGPETALSGADEKRDARKKEKRNVVPLGIRNVDFGEGRESKTDFSFMAKTQRQ